MQRVQRIHLPTSHSWKMCQGNKYCWDKWLQNEYCNGLRIYWESRHQCGKSVSDIHECCTIHNMSPQLFGHYRAMITSHPSSQTQRDSLPFSLQGLFTAASTVFKTAFLCHFLRKGTWTLLTVSCPKVKNMYTSWPSNQIYTVTKLSERVYPITNILSK